MLEVPFGRHKGQKNVTIGNSFTITITRTSCKENCPSFELNNTNSLNNDKYIYGGKLFPSTMKFGA